MNELAFYKHYHEHIMFKLQNEVFDRFSLPIDQKTFDSEILYKKITIPYMDFSITTLCSLSCKDCTEWIPYLKEKKIFSFDEIKKWLDNLFNNIEYVCFITILGGEPFLNPELYKIVKYLLYLQSVGYIGYIRIVTNGTIVPKDNVIKLLSESDVLVNISDYKNTGNNIKKLVEIFNQNNVKYFYANDFKWTDLGRPNGKKKLSYEQLSYYFETCFIKDCALFIEGKLYHCGRTYIVEKNGWDNPKDNEMIDFNTKYSKESIINKILLFYSKTMLSTCAYCNEPQNSKPIESAIQCSIQ